MIDRLITKYPRVITITSLIVKAVRTYNNAIFLIESSPIFSGNPFYRKPFVFLVIGIKLLTAYITKDNSSVRPIGALVKPSVLNRMVIKMSRHNKHLPFTGWLPHPFNPNYSYYVFNGEYTGIMIIPKFHLSPSCYYIEQIPTQNTIAIVSEFKQAKRLAECYHTENKAVNHNRGEPSVPRHNKIVTFPVDEDACIE